MLIVSSNAALEAKKPGKNPDRSPTKDLGEKLISMEEFCQKQGVFFNDMDNMKNSIKRSNGLFQEFKGGLNRGFQNFKNFGPEHPCLEELLKDDIKQKDDAPYYEEEI